MWIRIERIILRRLNIRMEAAIAKVLLDFFLNLLNDVVCLKAVPINKQETSPNCPQLIGEINENCAKSIAFKLAHRQGFATCMLMTLRSAVTASLIKLRPFLLGYRTVRTPSVTGCSAIDSN